MKAYVDSNIFVYSMFAHPRYGGVCKAIIDDLQDGVLVGTVSTLVPVEVMSAAVERDPEKADLAVTVIYSLPLEIFGVDHAILSLASNLALRYRLSGYDAVHLATARKAMVRNIISNDDDFRRVQEINLVKPLDYEKWKKVW